MLSSIIQSIDLLMDCTAWRFWTMRQSIGCSTPASRSSTAKQWFEELTQKMNKKSTSETFNTSLWRRKTKPASVNYFAIVVLATNKTCDVGGELQLPTTRFDDLWYISTSFCLFCVVEHHALKMTFHHNVKKNLFYVSTNISAFFPVYCLTRDRYHCLQW